MATDSTTLYTCTCILSEKVKFGYNCSRNVPISLLCTHSTVTPVKFGKTTLVAHNDFENAYLPTLAIRPFYTGS